MELQERAHCHVAVERARAYRARRADRRVGVEWTILTQRRGWGRGRTIQAVERHRPAAQRRHHDCDAGAIGAEAILQRARRACRLHVRHVCHLDPPRYGHGVNVAGHVRHQI